MNPFTPKELDMVRAKVQKALDEVGQELGMSIKMRKITYDKFSFKAPLEVTKIEQGVDPKLAAFKTSLRQYGHYFDLSEEDFMKEFEFNDRKGKLIYKILGVNPNSPKWAITVMDNNGDVVRVQQVAIAKYIAQRNAQHNEVASAN